jgi:para-aminobenzoate synthetase/4-amino-4-deoxychorismate lyase
MYRFKTTQIRGWFFYFNRKERKKMHKRNKFPINNVLGFLNQKKTVIMLESSLWNKDNLHSYIFADPVKIIQTHSLSGISKCLKQIEAETKKGYYLSGFISYEAGYAYSHKLQGLNHDSVKIPLIWMGVFESPLIFDHKSNKFNKKIDLKNYYFDHSCRIKNLKLNINKDSYMKNVLKIKQLIAQGDTYQVNYTTKYKFTIQGSPLALYKKLRENQAIEYGGLIKTPDFEILSFSPELFFRKNKNLITVKPMKGTAKRGTDIKEDRIKQKQLAADVKNQAENLMIVDLLRNDLGQISKTGTVKVKKLFKVEKYKTLFQMTSEISSILKTNTGFGQLFSSLFPSGSVTGAPKIRTMQIIRELEPEPRGIYTGSIGFIAPKGNAVFNVAIRTIQIKNNIAEMGIGSGITFSSDPSSEYDECKLKARFITMPEFKLIETMRWNKTSGISLLDHHLRRLKKSCMFFGIKFPKQDIIKQLHKLSRGLDKNTDYRIRLILDKDSALSFQSAAIENEDFTYARIILTDKKTEKDNLFLYHKNTNRSVYDHEYRKYKKLGFFDVIFKNRQDQITEGAISNIYIKKENKLYTPPIKSGVLPGVFRSYLMDKKNPPIEKTLYLEDLKNADAIYCSNAVRGMVRVELQLKPQINY